MHYNIKNHLELKFFINDKIIEEDELKVTHPTNYYTGKPLSITCISVPIIVLSM